MEAMNLSLANDETTRRKGRMGMGGHQGPMLKDEWLTPPEIIEALGYFDLDPCAPVNRPWPTAETHFTIEDDGLRQKWFGRVWLNPPYGPHTAVWLEKLANHGEGIALVFARTETEAWHAHVWPKAWGVMFLRGRLHFHHVTGKRTRQNAGAPSALIAYGQLCGVHLMTSGLPGRFVKL